MKKMEDRLEGSSWKQQRKGGENGSKNYDKYEEKE